MKAVEYFAVHADTVGVPAAWNASIFRLSVLMISRATHPSMNHLFIRQVVRIHISDEAIVDGCFDVKTTKPVFRLSNFDYSTVNDVCEI